MINVNNVAQHDDVVGVHVKNHYIYRPVENKFNGKLWWTSPSSIVLIWCLPITFVSYVAPISVTKFGSTDYRTIYSFGLSVLFYVCVLIPLMSKRRMKVENHTRKETANTKDLIDVNELLIKRVLKVLFILATLGYLLWFRSKLWDLTSTWNQLFSYRAVSLRNQVSTLDGLKSLTTFSLPFAYIYSSFRWRKIHLGGIYSLMFKVLLALTIFRTIFWNERLALIEFCFFYLMPFLTFKTFRGRIQKLFWNTIPLALPLLFYATEFFRSLRDYRDLGSNSQFVAQRLLQYYSNSFNNGAGAIQTFGLWNPNYDYPWSSITYFPFLRNTEVAKSLTVNYNLEFFGNYGNAEFNTFTGPLSIALAFGVIGIVVTGLSLGLAIRGCRTHFNRGALNVPAFFYPALIVGLLESPRIVYFWEARALVILVFSLIVVKLLKQKD